MSQRFAPVQPGQTPVPPGQPRYQPPPPQSPGMRPYAAPGPAGFPVCIIKPNFSLLNMQCN